MEEMRSVAAMIAAAAPRDTAPAEVRERLFTVIARERAGVESRRSRRAWVVRWAAAAAAVAMFVVGIMWLRGPGGEQPGGDLMARLADDHTRSASESRLVAHDPGLVRSWLTPQVSFAVHVPSLPNATLRGARVALVDGRRSAVLEYEVQGATVSYFVIPQPNGETVLGGPIHVQVTTRAGYRMVMWREPGLLHAMVGDLSPTQLTQLAHACIRQMGGVVAWVPRAVLPVAKRAT
jgi:anti-sigma factor RsiW